MSGYPRRKVESKIGRRLIFFNIAYRRKETFRQSRSATACWLQSELFTGIAQTNAGGFVLHLVVRGFSDHSLQLQVRVN